MLRAVSAGLLVGAMLVVPIQRTCSLVVLMLVVLTRALSFFTCCTQVFAGLLVGAMLPFWFSAMTMKSVGKAALAMVEEVRRQFNTINGLMEGTARPDYSRCVQISTDSSLREMIPPGELIRG